MKNNRNRKKPEIDERQTDIPHIYTQKKTDIQREGN